MNRPMQDHLLRHCFSGLGANAGNHAGLAPFNISRLPDFAKGTMASRASASVENDKVSPMQSVITTARVARCTLNVGILAVET